jgi:hypothetical protein
MVVVTEGMVAARGKVMTRVAPTTKDHMAAEVLQVMGFLRDNNWYLRKIEMAPLSATLMDLCIFAADQRNPNVHSHIYMSNLTPQAIQRAI